MTSTICLVVPKCYHFGTIDAAPATGVDTAMLTNEDKEWFEERFGGCLDDLEHGVRTLNIKLNLLLEAHPHLKRRAEAIDVIAEDDRNRRAEARRRGFTA